VGLVSDTQCKLCTPGKSSIATGIVSDDDCIICSDGHYTNDAGNTACSACQPGRYLKDDDNPSARTRYRHDQRTDCFVCETNRYQDEMGQAQCKSCFPLIINDNGNNPNEHDNKTDCQASCQSPIEYLHAIERKCNMCPSGSFCDGATKTPCSYGAFCPGDGKKYPCPPGKFGNGQGMSNESVCEDCPSGTYNRLPFSNSCPDRCPPGTYDRDRTGSKSFEEACKICPQGSYCQVGTLVNCPKGTFNNATGKASSNACKSCGYDKYNDVVGAKDHSECKDCGIDPVTLKKKSTKTETATSEQECELVQFACEFGTDAPAQRPVSATVNVCEDCQAGYHGDGLGNRCILCAVGYYQDQVAQQDCKICTSDLCHMASGVTSDAILFQAGSPDSLPIEFEFALEKNNIDQTHPLLA